MCLILWILYIILEIISNKVLGGSLFRFCALLGNGEGKKMSLKALCVLRQGEWCAEEEEGRADERKKGKVSTFQTKKELVTCAKICTPHPSSSSYFLFTGPDRFYMFRFSSIFIVQLLQSILIYRKYSDGLYMDNILLVLYCWLGFLWLKPKLINFLLLSKHQSLYLTVGKCQSFFLLQTFHLFQRLCVHI